jgi:hypothetical protein
LFGKSAKRQSRWVAVLDSSVLVGAVTATSADSGSKRVVEAAILDVYDCVLSAFIREETTRTLALPRCGSLTPTDVDEILGALWQAALWVPLSENHASIAGVVKDENDIPILRTALGIMESGFAQAQAPMKFLVSNNSKDFPPDRNVWGFQYATGHQFWMRLRQ